jgi:hypothetical protein
MMTEDEKQTGPRYEALKQRLWNQPRPRQFLERLEQYCARPALLERVARLFAAGRHGEAEILAAIYSDLSRHRDRADLLRRIGALRIVSSQIEQDLLSVASGLERVRGRETCVRKLGLSDRIIRALIAVGKRGCAVGLDPLLRGLVEEYVKASKGFLLQSGNDHAKEEKWALLLELKLITDLRQILSRLHRNLQLLACELYRFKVWEVCRRVGYEDFHAFVGKELGLSDKTAETLVMIREEAGLGSSDTVFQVIIKGYTASVETIPKGRAHARKAP